MNDKTYELLTALSNKLGVASSVIWDATLKQSYLEIIPFTFVFILLCGFAYALYRTTLLAIKDNDWFPLPVVCGAIVLCLLCFSMAYAHSLATALYNPEYWAFERLLCLVKP